jgi:lysophospholipase L1-like esterase
MRKSMLLLLIGLLLGLGSSLSAKNGVIRVVVLGSSTAAGTGPTNSANAWVNQYRKYVQSINSSSEVINLAAGYYTTYQVLPTGTAAVTDRPAVDTVRNITKALSYSPDAIIINLPTNDATNGYTVNEQLYNYSVVLAAAKKQGVPVWITTTQPRNLSVDYRLNLIAMKDSTYKFMGDKAIDFWTDIANVDGTINTLYDMGDGVHLNDSAHSVLARRVIAKTILDASRYENDLDTINIDFGAILSTGGWNNLDVAQGDTVFNLINSKGQNTGADVMINDAFTGVNAFGTTAPDATLDLPSSATNDNFFGSVGAHGGVIEATGGFLMTGLNVNNIYSFAFFASRLNVTDNRETMYIVSGKTTDTVYLDASNNISKIATVSGMVPAADGTVRIVVGPGLNNTNTLKYYFLGALRITSMSKSLTYDKNGTVNIDLGSKLSTGYWNNLTIPTGGQVLSDLVNMEGNSTGMSAWVHDAFTGINEAGTTTPDATLDLQSNGSSDSFFGSVLAHSGVIEATGGVTLGNLSTTSKYSLSFFASRAGITDNRETQYAVTGATTQTVYLDPANNTSKMVTVADMIPAADGTIKVDVAPGPNNTNASKYYFLGAIRVVYAPISDALNPVKLNGKVSISSVAYPNPFQNQVTIECTLPEAGDWQIQVYNLQGQLVRSLESKQLQSGRQTTEWNGTDATGKALPDGMYVCRIRLVGACHVYTETLKLQMK